tara:strand:- start:1867 stop:3147 length:1281 start_codon:yes stop_codon:yes gene_type:complete
VHDIKLIKKNPENFDDSLKKRNLNPCSSQVIGLHDQYLNYLNEKQSLQETKNSLSKQFSNKNENKDEIKANVLKIKKKIDNLTLLAEKKNYELERILLNLPNILSEETPVGKSEDDNVIVKDSEKIHPFTFKPKNHLEIAEKFNLIDYDSAIKLSGSRFSILKNDLAIIHRALINFMLDNNTREFNFKECVVPELVKPSSLEGTGQLPKFDDDLFKTNFNDLYLIPTSEVPLTNLHRESIINLKELPIKYTAFSNCFRAEAGASGKDTKGLIREHQFGKVELVTFSEPSNSRKELDRMIACVESIIKKLNLPFRVVKLCSGDIGFSSSLTFDFEIWMPGQNKFREVSSCSNCTDFQSRRMKTRVKDFETGEIYFPHTLNGSSLAVGRLLIAILENFQQEDCSVEIPGVLTKYTNGLTKISNDDKKN